MIFSHRAHNSWPQQACTRDVEGSLYDYEEHGRARKSANNAPSGVWVCLLLGNASLSGVGPVSAHLQTRIGIGAARRLPHLLVLLPYSHYSACAHKSSLALTNSRVGHDLVVSAPVLLLLPERVAYNPFQPPHPITSINSSTAPCLRSARTLQSLRVRGFLLADSRTSPSG